MIQKTYDTNVTFGEDTLLHTSHLPIRQIGVTIIYWFNGNINVSWEAFLIGTLPRTMDLHVRLLPPSITKTQI